jgi:cell volume regulation protein A
VLLVVRFPGAWLAMLHAPLDDRQRRIVFLSLPRGVAAGVLATLPVSAGLAGMEDLPTVAFACVFATILIFATGFPLIMRGAPPVDSPAPPDPIA